MRIALLIVCLAASMAVAPAVAVNLSFMPGDAFFSTRVTSEVTERLPTDGGRLEFSYAYLDGSGDFCGYAGFTRLELLDASSTFVHHVRSVYRAIRDDAPLQIEVRYDDEGNRNETELNGLHAFVYNRNVDWSQQRLGIKYNEGGFSLPKSALVGPRRNKLFNDTACMHYISFVPGAEAVANDWMPPDAKGSSFHCLRWKVGESQAPKYSSQCW